MSIAAFATLNWNVFIAPTELSLGLMTIRIPLGLVMLALLSLLTVIFLGFVIYLQTSALLQTSRYSRELKANRELANQAEASRFHELKGFLEMELLKIANINAESKTEVFAKIEHLEDNLRFIIEQSGNTLAAYIGELEDRIENLKIT